jgi:hypothetical protein
VVLIAFFRIFMSLKRGQRKSVPLWLALLLACGLAGWVTYQVSIASLESESNRNLLYFLVILALQMISEFTWSVAEEWKKKSASEQKT